MEKDEKIHLKRQISLLGGVAIVVGNMIGTGIFISPKGVLEGTQSVALCLIVWGGCGLVSLCGALCYAELGTMITKSGADYAYLLEIFGSFPAFVYCFVMQLVRQPAGAALGPLIAATYLLAPILGDCGTNEIIVKCLSCTLLISIFAVNVLSTKATVIGSELFTFLKLMAAGIVIIGGFVTLGNGRDEGLYRGFTGNTIDAVGIVEACYSAFFAYGGWNSLNYVTEELKNSKKNLPRAIVISMVVVILVYLAMNISYFVVLGPERILKSDAVAVSFEEELMPTKFIMAMGVFTSTYGASLSNLLLVARLSYVAARDGHLPEFMSFVHVKRNTPYPAIVYQVAVTFVMIFLGDVRSLINFVGILEWTFIGMNMAGLIILRFKRKDAPRPYKVPIVFPVMMVIVSLYLVIVPIVLTHRVEYLIAVGVSALAGIFYIPFMYLKKKMPGTDKLTVWVQLLAQVAPSGQNMDE